MMMKYFVVSLSLLLFVLSATFAQGKNDRSIDTTNLWLSLKNINFVKDNEYSNPVTEGYTLIGYFIQPELVYAPANKIRIQLGAHILGYSGAEKISRPKLVFSTTYNFSKNSTLTLGSLSGAEKHRMPDPVFNYERLYTAYHEDGLQFVTGNDRLFSDTWINWENYIFRGDTTREVFTAGESFSYKTKKIGDFLTL
jgi:hypothetical protein